jgi:hypothetical protein
MTSAKPNIGFKKNTLENISNDIPSNVLVQNVQDRMPSAECLGQNV